jgi:hypothetical protein
MNKMTGKDSVEFMRRKSAQTGVEKEKERMRNATLVCDSKSKGGVQEDGGWTRMGVFIQGMPGF